MPLVKSYGQQKFVAKITAIYLVFWPRFDLIFSHFFGGGSKQSRIVKAVKGEYIVLFLE